jgi:hypothetical protein
MPYILCLIVMLIGYHGRVVSESVSYLEDPGFSHVSHSLQANTGTVL